MSVIDNLLKGASGQAVQNMNVMLGLDETDRGCCDARRDRARRSSEVRRRAARGSRAPADASSPRDRARSRGAAAPLVIVHGGGKEIDAALKAAGIEKRQVDGLRITDEATLDVVVAVLAGAVNTRLVAALNAAGVAAVGLTGADAACGLVDGRAAAPDGRRAAWSISGASASRATTPTCGC